MRQALFGITSFLALGLLHPPAETQQSDRAMATVSARVVSSADDPLSRGVLIAGRNLDDGWNVSTGRQIDGVGFRVRAARRGAAPAIGSPLPAWNPRRAGAPLPPGTITLEGEEDEWLDLTVEHVEA